MTTASGTSPTAAVPSTVAFFTTPANDITPGGPSKITEAITTLLRSAAENANVRIAIYEMGPRSGGRLDQVGAIADAVRFAAHERNATVLIVTDHKRRTVRQVGQKVNSALVGLDAADNIKVRWCKAGCLSSATRTPSGGVPLMHNKFITVDNTIMTPRCCERVVLQMTSNWTNGQLRDRRWNSAVQVAGNDSLFAGYVNYWNRLWDCGKGRGHCRSGNPMRMAVDDPTDVRVHVSPRGAGNPDPVLADLDDLDCGLGPAAGLPTGPSGIDIAMGAWTNPDGRGGRIVDKLAALNAECQIRIVLQRNRQPIIARLLEAGLRPRCSEGVANRELRLPSVHSKYMLVRGNYQGGPAVAVFTGSANFTKKSLEHNDETWMRFLARPLSHPGNATVYTQYRADFDAMWAQTLPCRLVDLPAK